MAIDPDDLQKLTTAEKLKLIEQLARSLQPAGKELASHDCSRIRQQNAPLPVESASEASFGKHQERKHRIPGSARGLISMASDFDAPLEDFKDYS